MGLPLGTVRKGVLMKEVFMSDENGFKGNILMEEGEKWQTHRKARIARKPRFKKSNKT